ncbi:MAG TPA: ABC transporter ATP-binding protein [Silvibacterium sp.]|nr:ABC transporter ATP-binding protein [Silvibacterium sp.]
MSDVIISVENLGKKYRITHQAQQRSSYKSLREIASNGAKNLLRTAMGFARRQHGPDESQFRSSKEDFWALRDVSFDVKRGEALGIVGRNGAGKSTLLKILSRITEPSGGRVALRGRVASLLEVGTGFHPELTGRENIFLNGAIMGMTKTEIRCKFDEIVAFAEVEKFLDTPVKRYSSGMYVRLAFSVAAHLEPEILIVDEVLAVGDVQFQNKCLGKMQDVASKDGRTVLFVSHNIPAVLRLCGLACWLDKGHMLQTGTAHEIIASYLRSATSSSHEWTRADSKARTKPCITQIGLANFSRGSSESFTTADALRVSLTVQSPVVLSGCQIAIRVTTADGSAVFTTTSSDLSLDLTTLEEGTTDCEVVIPGNFLSSGSYSLICAILIPGGELLDVVADKLRFDLHSGLNHATYFGDGRQGLITPLIEWTITQKSCGVASESQ